MKSTDIYLVILVVAFCIVGFKLYRANSSFEEYITESTKPRNIYECLSNDCFKDEFKRRIEISVKKLLVVTPVRGCYQCKESFEKEMVDRLKHFQNIEYVELDDAQLKNVMAEHHIQLEHVTLIAMDRYKTYYVYEYHPQFPQKQAKTEAFLTFLDEFNK